MEPRIVKYNAIKRNIISLNANLFVKEKEAVEIMYAMKFAVSIVALQFLIITLATLIALKCLTVANMTVVNHAILVSVKNVQWFIVNLSLVPAERLS